tara:strand:- start:4979 stop:5164 length:186 start_codon:yes stop_codon:yes gene_type:complete
MSRFDKFIVVWEDEDRFRTFDPFRNKEEAYAYMLEKLSEGKWALMGEKGKIPKIYYSHERR